MMMTKHNDYYRTLQVHHDAGQDVIDAAYRCLCKMYHPDLNQNPSAAEKMKFINIAYGILGDEKKRRIYHIEWLKNQVVKPASTPTPTPSPAKNTVRDERLDTDLAAKVLDEFFRDTVNESWESAYQKLTSVDQNNIPREDFLEWKKAVSQMYRLGNYKITFFRKYQNCDYAGVIYPVIYQFSVALTEMQIVTGRISEEVTQKYVAFNGDGCRVCLGYLDLKPTIKKFKYLAQALPKMDKDEIFMKAVAKIDPLTGVLSLSGFKEQAEREMLRSCRYGNPLTMAVVTVKPSQSQDDTLEEYQLDACISYISEILCGNIRKTDMIGRCDDSSFGILFTETKQEDAEEALNKLLELCQKDDFLSFQLCTAIANLNIGDVELSLKEAMERVVPREKVKEETSPLEAEEKAAKLGKYKLSDILGFNKRGKNHF
jgi:GGDEF domain-containing protein